MPQVTKNEWLLALPAGLDLKLVLRTSYGKPEQIHDMRYLKEIK